MVVKTLAEWLNYTLKMMSYDLSLLSLITHNNCIYIYEV